MKIDYLFIINIDYITDYITRAIYSPVFFVNSQYYSSRFIVKGRNNENFKFLFEKSIKNS